jgi:oligopeptide transport system ATP-binding protein
MSYPSAMASFDESPLIHVQGLTVKYLACEPAAAVFEVDFDIARGEIIGILGESGSGKSTLALSILGLLPANTSVQGSILFRKSAPQDQELQGEDLLHLNELQWRAIRGARISMIFQEPGLSLSPVMRIGDQIAEVRRAHRRGIGKLRKQEIEAILRRVRLSDTDRVYNAYPHQLSGGELHRVAIAQALVCRPDLVIADEPTRSLDVTLQAEVLNVLREVNRDFGTALLFITHNPALLAGFADRVIVMYAGRIVEEGPLWQVFRRPLHPYTKALLQLVPRLSENAAFDSQRHLPVIPGSRAESVHFTRGCVFEPRCSARTAVCRDDSPNAATPEQGRRVRCFNYGN